MTDNVVRVDFRPHRLGHAGARRRQPQDGRLGYVGIVLAARGQPATPENVARVEEEQRQRAEWQARALSPESREPSREFRDR